MELKNRNDGLPHYLKDDEMKVLKSPATGHFFE